MRAYKHISIPQLGVAAMTTQPDDVREADSQQATIDRLQARVAELERKLDREENAHAELQARCFDNGQPTFGSVFNQVESLQSALSQAEARIREAPVDVAARSAELDGGLSVWVSAQVPSDWAGHRVAIVRLTENEK